MAPPRSQRASRAACERASRSLRRTTRRIDKTLRSIERKGAGEPERIHKLRVATRRASAAARCLKDPRTRPRLRKAARRLAGRLRAVRNAAGPVRDADVLLARLAAYREDRDPAVARAADDLAGHLTREDESARADLRRRARALRIRFGPAARNARRRLRGRRARRLITAAHRRLSSDLEEAATATTRDLERPERLHELRIALKRVRYTLDLLAAAESRRHDRAAARGLRFVQDTLGKANDARLLHERARRWTTDQPPPGVSFSDVRALLDRLGEDRRIAEEEARSLARSPWLASLLDELTEGRPPPPAS